MRILSVVCLMLAAALLVNGGLAQEKLSKEEWQQEMDKYKKLRDDLDGKAKDLTNQVGVLQTQSTKLDGDYQKCRDELFALVGSDAAKAAAFRAEIEAAESKANELMRLSDADLMARSAEVAELDTKVKGLWENKLSLIPEFYDRLTALNEKVTSLKNAVAGTGKVYTVGTWRRDRDCLWNISKKRDIYNDPWKWPKIWQGNRDQIKDPDVIHQGQKLKIPANAELTGEERAAAKTYYARKAARGK